MHESATSNLDHIKQTTTTITISNTLYCTVGVLLSLENVHT